MEKLNKGLSPEHDMTGHDDGRSQQGCCRAGKQLPRRESGHTWLRAANFSEQLFLQNPHILAPNYYQTSCFIPQGEDELGWASRLPRGFEAQEPSWERSLVIFDPRTVAMGSHSCGPEQGLMTKSYKFLLCLK